MIDYKPPDPDVVSLPFGDVYPPAPAPSGTGFSGREHALRALKRFMACIVFERRGARNQPPIRFMVPSTEINIYEPDDVKNVEMPFTIGVHPGLGSHEAFTLGPAAVDESTMDKYGVGTVLVDRSEYDEQIQIELLSSKHAMLVALECGLSEAFTTWQDSYALRLRLPDYYDQVATFELVTTQYQDDGGAFKNRRRCLLGVNMAVPEVSLVRYKPFRPETMQRVGVGIELDVKPAVDGVVPP